MRFDASGTFGEKEALAFASAFESAAKRIGVEACAILTAVGEKSADEYRVSFQTEFLFLGSYLKFFQDGYDQACDFRRIV